MNIVLSSTLILNLNLKTYRFVHLSKMHKLFTQGGNKNTLFGQPKRHIDSQLRYKQFMQLRLQLTESKEMTIQETDKSFIGMKRTKITMIIM